MKSAYRDNFRHKIVLIQPVYGKKTKQSGKPIVLGLCDSKAEAIRYQQAAQERFAKRPGKIVVMPASAQPTVGCRGGRFQQQVA